MTSDLDEMMGGPVGPGASQFDPWGMFSCLIALHSYRLPHTTAQTGNRLGHVASLLAGRNNRGHFTMVRCSYSCWLYLHCVCCNVTEIDGYIYIPMDC